MIESANPISSSREFLSSVERLLAPAYAECFSDETRKTRNVLLIVSAVLIFSALGLVALSQDSVKVPTLAISLTIKGGMRWVLVPLCGYLLILHSARSYAEWNLWRLRHQAPMMELSDLGTLIWSQLAERSARLTGAFTLSAELHKKLSELTADPPELVEAARHHRVLYDEYQRLGDQTREKQLPPREFEEEAYKLHKMFEDFMRLGDEIKRQREEHRTRTAAEREDLERRLREVGEAHRTEVAAPDFTELNAKLAYLAEAVRPVTRVKSIRFGIEVLFPTGFAIAAILAGVVVR